MLAQRALDDLVVVFVASPRLLGDFPDRGDRRHRLRWQYRRRSEAERALVVGDGQGDAVAGLRMLLMGVASYEHVQSVRLEQPGPERITARPVAQPSDSCV
jgi:hypothetical protein